MTPQPNSTAPWHQLMSLQARAHPIMALGLGLALLAVGALWLQASLQPATEADAFTRWALWGGAAGFAATTLGALPALFFGNLRQKTEDVLLGTAAGMMLAAAAFSLLLPGIEAGTRLTGHASWGAALVVAGMALGVMLMLGLDAFTPPRTRQDRPLRSGP